MQNLLVALQYEEHLVSLQHFNSGSFTLRMPRVIASARPYLTAAKE